MDQFEVLETIFSAVEDQNLIEDDWAECSTIMNELVDCMTDDQLHPLESAVIARVRQGCRQGSNLVGRCVVRCGCGFVQNTCSDLAIVYFCGKLCASILYEGYAEMSAGINLPCAFFYFPESGNGGTFGENAISDRRSADRTAGQKT